MKLMIRNEDGTRTPLVDKVKELKQLAEEIGNDLIALQESMKEVRHG